MGVQRRYRANEQLENQSKSSRRRYREKSSWENPPLSPAFRLWSAGRRPGWSSAE
jgi:hypothetical protein